MARDFNGSSGYLTAVGALGDPFQLSRWTAGGWVRLDTANQSSCIVSCEYTGTAIPLVVSIGVSGQGTPGNWTCGFHVPGWVMISDVVAAPLGIWTHVIGRFDGTNLTLFVNGVAVASSAPGANAVVTGAGFFVGRRWDIAGTPYIDGRLEHVCVWNTPLWNEEITGMATGHRLPPRIRPTNIVAYWPLKDGYGPGGAGGTKDYFDRRPLTLSGGVTLTNEADPRLVEMPPYSLGQELQRLAFFAGRVRIGVTSS